MTVQKRSGKKHKNIPTLWEVLEVLAPVIVRKRLSPRYKMGWNFKETWGHHSTKEKEATTVKQELYWGYILERPDGNKLVRNLKVPDTKFQLMLEFGWLYLKESESQYKFWYLTKKGKEAVRKYSEKYKKQLHAA